LSVARTPASDRPSHDKPRRSSSSASAISVSSGSYIAAKSLRTSRGALAQPLPPGPMDLHRQGLVEVYSLGRAHAACATGLFTYCSVTVHPRSRTGEQSVVAIQWLWSLRKGRASRRSRRLLPAPPLPILAS
jgi:hypothetical protein